MTEHPPAADIEQVLVLNPAPDTCDRLIAELRSTENINALVTRWHSEGLTLMEAQDKTLSAQGVWMTAVADALMPEKAAVILPFKNPGEAA